MLYRTRIKDTAKQKLRYYLDSNEPMDSLNDDMYQRAASSPPIVFPNSHDISPDFKLIIFPTETGTLYFMN